MDLSAGITVGVMLIPQGMAYAMIAGLPPIYGLYAAIFPQLIYALLGTSRQLAVGPVAMDSIIVATGVSALAVANSEHYILLAILLAFMVGIIQLSMGILRLGFIVNFLSKPVINGFTYAAALVISINQLTHITGVTISQNKYVYDILLEFISKTDQINWVSVLVGLTGIFFLLLTKKINKLIPGALIVVILSIVSVNYFHLEETGLKIIGSIPIGLPGFNLPDISSENVINLLPVAATLALIGFMEAFSISKALEPAHKNEYRIDANKELIALGAGNIFGSFFSSFPTSGGFSRSAVSEANGAKTAIASYVSAGLVLITALFFTPLFYYLPNAILAVIILVAVLGLIDLKQCKYLWQTDRADFYMMLSTFSGTLIIGIKEGILIGVGLSLAMMIYKTTQPHMAVLGQIPNTNFFKNIKRFKEAVEIKGFLIVRFDSRIYFANVNFFKEKIEELVLLKGNDLKVLIIDAQSISSIDSSGMLVLHELLDFCRTKNIELTFVSVIGPVRDIFVKEGFADAIGEDHCFEQIDLAISTFTNSGEKELHNRLGFQTNVDR